jgi:predicted Zn-dependent protease
MKLSQKLGTAIKDKQWDEADSTINEIEKLLPEEQRGGLAYARFTVCVAKGDAKAASKCAAKVSGDDPDNAMLQNQLAWTLLTSKDLKDPDLDVVEKIAVRANDAAKGKDPAILDTLARAYFVHGKKEKAVETQELALKLAEDDAKGQFRKTLDSYKEGKLPAAED